MQDEASAGDDGDFEKEEDERNKIYKINEKHEVRAGGDPAAFPD